MAHSKPCTPSMTTAMFTREDIEYNRMTGDQQGQCELKKTKLNCIDKDGLVYSIKIRNLKGIEMFGTFYSVNKHRHENIIALTIGNNIKFLKFDNRDDMERWYSELMKPLRREGWTEEADETQPGRRCATSPAGLQKPMTKPVTRRPYGSAYGSLQGFVSKADKRKGVYEIPAELLNEEPQSSESSTDSSEDGEDDVNPDCIYEETKTEDLPGNDSANASVHYENTKDLSSPIRRRNARLPQKNFRVIGHNNIIITDVSQQTGCELNINCKDITVVAELKAELQNQMTKVVQLTELLVSALTRVKGDKTAGTLQDHPLLCRTCEEFAANGGELQQVQEGSIVFVVRFKSKEDLKRFWLAYTSGELAQSLTECLITPDIEQRAGCKVSLQLNIQESEYKSGLQALDEAESEPLYVVSKGNVSERHSYVNLPVDDTGTASAQKRQTIPGDFQTTESAIEPTYMECEEDNTNLAFVRNLRKSEYTPLIINPNPSTTRAYEQLVSGEPQLTKLKPKPPPVAAKPKSRELTSKAKDVAGGDNSNAVHGMKPSTEFKTKLSTILPAILHKGTHPMIPSNSDDYLEPRSRSRSEDNIYIDIDKSTYSPTELNEDQELYEVFEQPQEVEKLTQKSKSLHISSLNTPSQVRPRKQSAPLPVSNSKEALVTTDQPPVPWRNGETLSSSISTFRRLQEEDSITVVLIKTAICNGKRLALVKVKGLTYVWIDHWDLKGPPLEEKIHPGDQILSINGKDLKDCDVTTVYKQIGKSKEQKIAFQLRRAPHANVLHLQSSAECCDLGIELDGNVIRKVNPDGLFSKVSKSKTTGVLSSNLVEWAITEINMQPVNHKYSSEQIQELLDKAGPHIALVIQPSDLVLAMKKAYQP